MNTPTIHHAPDAARKKELFDLTRKILARNAVTAAPIKLEATPEKPAMAKKERG